jgi:hypothetical protein
LTVELESKRSQSHWVIFWGISLSECTYCMRIARVAKGQKLSDKFTAFFQIFSMGS